jgi:hypothetical protein
VITSRVRPRHLHYPPDTQVASLWLPNRQPAKWRDRQQVDVVGTIEHRLAAMTPEEREADARAFGERLRRALAAAAERERQAIEGEVTEVEGDSAEN